MVKDLIYKSIVNGVVTLDTHIKKDKAINTSRRNTTTIMNMTDPRITAIGHQIQVKLSTEKNIGLRKIKDITQVRVNSKEEQNLNIEIEYH